MHILRKYIKIKMYLIPSYEKMPRIEYKEKTVFSVLYDYVKLEWGEIGFDKKVGYIWL